MNWQDCIEHQATLYHLAARPRMLDWMWGLTRFHPDFPGISMVGTYRREERALPEATKRRVLDLVQLGEPYAVSRDVTNLIDAAAADLPGHAAMRVTDVPSPHGFLLFDRPLRLPYRITIEPGPEQDVPFAGFAWAVTSDGTGLNVLLLVDWRKERAEWRPLTSFAYAPLGLSGFRFGETLDEANANEALDTLMAENRERAVMMHRYIYTTMLFLGQQVVTHHRRPVDRAARRRLVQKRWHHVANPEVLFVELRRIAPPRDRAGGDPVEHDFRWWVSAHFRTFWTGPGRTVPVVKFVRAFTKGPEDKPLRDPRPRVFLVQR